MRCHQCDGEAVRNEVLGKEFYYCRTCKVEVEDEAIAASTLAKYGVSINFNADKTDEEIVSWAKLFPANTAGAIASLGDAPSAVGYCGKCGNFYGLFAGNECGCKP